MAPVESHLRVKTCPECLTKQTVPDRTTTHLICCRCGFRFQWRFCGCTPKDVEGEPVE